MQQTYAEADWDDYPRIASGVYPAFCARGRWYLDKNYQRHTCLLHFDVLAPDLTTKIARVPLWLNGGNGEKPRATRRTRFLAEWLHANGAPPPRGDKLALRVFIGRMAIVRVGDTRGRAPYTVVKEILEWSTGVKQSISHTVKYGTTESLVVPQHTATHCLSEEEQDSALCRGRV